MQMIRVDYKIEADLVAPNATTFPTMTNRAGYEVRFRNAEPNEDGHFTKLIAAVTGPSEDIAAAQVTHRTHLAEMLDILSFVSHSRFKIIEPLRAMEWDRGQKERQFIVFQVADPRDPPDPELEQELLDSVTEVERHQVPDYIRTALKYFRYGTFENQPDDQFMRYWMALEIIAENSVEKRTTTLICRHCKKDLACLACGTMTDVPKMPKNRILELVTSVTGEVNGATLTQKLYLARNTLMHGGSIKRAEEKTKIQIDELINHLANIVWHLIFYSIPNLRNKQLTIGHRGGQFANLNYTASVNGAYTHSSDDEQPTDEMFENMKFTVKTSFRQT
jgi:hypothetical protein